MIVYDLKCAKGHVFEGWFDGLAGFEDQQARGLVTCPVCGDVQVERKPSTFGIGRHRDRRDGGRDTGAALGVHPAELFRRYIEDNFEDVGANFAKEALKIHYGASQSRSIRGVSTSQEEEMLAEEGVEFFKFPLPAKDEETQ